MINFFPHKIQDLLEYKKNWTEIWTYLIFLLYGNGNFVIKMFIILKMKWVFEIKRSKFIFY